MIAIAAGGFFTWRYWNNLHHSEPVEDDTALTAFRAAPKEGLSAAGIPRMGVYTYRQSGSEKGGLGPLAITRTLPSVAQLVITPRADGYQRQLYLSADHLEATRYQLGADGFRETWVRTKLGFGFYSRDDARPVVPKPLAFPRRPRVGQTWTERYSLGSLATTAVSRVLRQESIPMDGQAFPVVVIETRLVTLGTHPGNERDTLWWSPERGIAIRAALTRKIRGAVTLDVTSNLELESLTPTT